MRTVVIGGRWSPVSTDTRETARMSLHDATLDAEIQLVGDLVVAATGSDGRLSQDQIDAALGVVLHHARSDDRFS
jgi:hypothetical protein